MGFYTFVCECMWKNTFTKDTNEITQIKVNSARQFVGEFIITVEDPYCIVATYVMEVARNGTKGEL